jgi:probable rRNA maturation factor
MRKKVSGVSRPELERFTARARRAVGLRGEVNVLVAPSAELRRLNRQFRKQDKPTDVLSFPPPARGMAGDIAISADIARASARRLGHPFAAELKVLVLHGLLHLAGYDHERDTGEMRRKEERLRAALGLPAALIARAERPAARPRKAGRR